MPVKDIDGTHQVFHTQCGDTQVVGFELGHVDQYGVWCCRQTADV